MPIWIYLWSTFILIIYLEDVVICKRKRFLFLCCVSAGFPLHDRYMAVQLNSFSRRLVASVCVCVCDCVCPATPPLLPSPCSSPFVPLHCTMTQSSSFLCTEHLRRTAKTHFMYETVVQTGRHIYKYKYNIFVVHLCTIYIITWYRFRPRAIILSFNDGIVKKRQTVSEKLK